jgi:nitrilase
MMSDRTREREVGDATSERSMGAAHAATERWVAEDPGPADYDGPPFVLAAVQAAPVFLDKAATTALVCRLIRQAGERGADVIAFPENFIPGHPYWFQFYNAYDAISRKFSVEYFKNAVEVPGPETQAIGDAVRDAGAWTVVGMCERDHGTLGTLFNTLVFFAPDGTIVGKHRKIALTNAERLVQAPGDGSTLRTYATPFGGIGGLICGENLNSLARNALFLQGQTIHVASWPSFGGRFGREWLETIDLRVRIAALEASMYVISAAAIWSEAMMDVLELDEAARASFSFRGGHSGIVAPNGTYIAGPTDEEESILLAQGHPEEIMRAKVSQDLSGHYQRFDIFQLSVSSARPHRGIHRVGGDAAGGTGS